MILVLTRGSSSMCVPLRLPTSPEEEGEVFAQLDAISTDVHSTRIVRVEAPVWNLGNYIKSTDINGDGYGKLKQLAGQLDAMTERERWIFSGALDAESINGLDDVLRAADRIGEYTLLPEACSDATLGKYMVNHGFFDCPESIKPYLDYEAIGAFFYSESSGSYTKDGYVVRSDELPAFLNQQEEPWQDDKRIEVFRLKLQSGSAVYELVLPGDDEYLDDVCAHLGVSEFADAKLLSAVCTIPYLSELLPMDCISAESANKLALTVEEMQEIDGELLKFCAALSVEQPSTFQEALEIACHIDDYERITEGTYEYGQTVLRRIGADDEIIDAIDGYMDFERFGDAMMDEDGVRETEFGLVRRLSEPFPQQDMGMKFM